MTILKHRHIAASIHRGNLEALESRHLLSANVVINEVHYDPPNPDVHSEFIELYNAESVPVDLSGWKFTDGLDFTFPPGASIGPQRHVVVTEDLDGYMTEFGHARGEEVIAYQIEARTRGNQSFEGSLGMDFVVNQTVKITELGVFDSNGSGLRRAIQSQLWQRDDNGTPRDFSDDRGVRIVAEISFSPESEGTLIGGSRFKALEQPVTLAPGAYSIVAFGYGSREGNRNGEGAPVGLTDSGGGLISFVGSSRFGDPGQFPATVDGGPANRYAAGTFRFSSAEPLPPFADPIGVWTGQLANDGERITLRDAEGTVTDEITYGVGFPWPTSAQGEGASMELLNAQLDNDLGGSWRSSFGTPSPGLENTVHSTNAGPQIRQVNHSPREPASNDTVVITAKVTDPDDVSQVLLQYQLVEPGRYIRLTDSEYQTAWTTVQMNDAGEDGDALPGDDIYSVRLPASLQNHRSLVRYRVDSTDARGNLTSAPYEDDPQPNFAYFVYDGIPAWTGADRPGRTEPITYDTGVMNSLPAYHLIAVDSDVTDSQYVQRFNGVRFLGTLVFNGTVYDHIEFNNRGQFSTYVSGKNKWKLHFRRGHEFEITDDYGQPWKTKVRKLNFGTAASPWARPNRGLAAMDEALAFKFFNLAGVAAPRTSAFQLRVIDDAVEADSESQYEGDLWGLYLAFEDPGGKFLEEHDLPDGNLFRMQSGGIELRHKGEGLPNDFSDVQAFVSPRTGYNKRNPVQPVEWWRENVDLETYYSYRAVIEAVNHSDLRDQENSLQYFNAASGKWTQLPWDLDLLYEEFDRWGPDGVQTTTPLEQFRKALEHKEILVEFQARLREMQDLLFNDDQAWQAVEEYARYVEPFAAVDRAMWDWHPRTSPIHKGFFYRSPAPYHGGAQGEVRRELTSPDFEGMINWVKEFIVPGGFGGDQTIELYRDPQIPETPNLTYAGSATFPINQLRFQTTPFRDPQGNATFGGMEWRIGEVTDPSAPAFDPAEPIHFELTAMWESGELIDFVDTVEVDANQLRVGHAYRARVRVKDDTGRWSHWSAPVQFVAGDPLPSDTHVLRVAEINYHPHDAFPQFGEANVDNDQFEFIELVNTGSSPIDLGGARFAQRQVGDGNEGIEFLFGPQSLEPAQRIVVVRDRTAFQSRYGSDVPIAQGNAGEGLPNGQYRGALSNAGELVTLLDARGGVIQTFTYDDNSPWPDRADGRGSSLELRDVTTDYANPTSWQASHEFGGTPGRASTEADPRIVINEVLARTDAPDADFVELYNTTDNAIDVSGWYVGDSNDDLFRFQIGDSSTIPAHGYVTFDQNQLGFGFSGSGGDEAWLVEASANGQPQRFVDRVSFGASRLGVSFGRWPNGAGSLFPMSQPTPGQTNSGREVGDSNADGVFDQLDVVRVLHDAKYLSGEDASFEQGDWNEDGRFDPLDIVFALANGDYSAA